MKKRAIILAAAFTGICACTAFASEPELITLNMHGRPVGDLAPLAEIDELNELTPEEEGSMDRAMRAYRPGGDSLIRNNAFSFYYYDQLDPESQAIYDCMMMVAEDPVSEDNYAMHLTASDPSSDEFFMKAYTAYTAMTYDHPELFWLYNGIETTIGFGSSRQETSGMYPVYFYMSEPYAKYEEQMTAFNAAADAFLADIDVTGSEYDIALQIHDKLIDMVTYDDIVMENSQAEGSNLAHTAYGALVADSYGTANYAVCDGYSLAFEYLCSQCGLDTIFVGGMAGGSELDAGGHAWNLVKLDGVWYEVDSTWDDYSTYKAEIPESTNGYSYFVEALDDPDYFNALEHYLFCISTDQIRNYKMADDLYYYTKDGAYVLSLAFDSVHIRFTPEMSIIQGGIISMAPNATGTLH